MQSPLLIGLASALPRSGKSQTAQALIDHGLRPLPFASPLKEIGVEILVRIGIPLAEARRFLYIDKHEVIPGLGVTGRHFLQTLGTDWGRNLINREIWTLAWRGEAQRLLARGCQLVVDDVRFPDEAELIRSLGGHLWWISRPGLAADGSALHESEGQLVDSPLITRTIVNSGTLEQLHEAAIDALHFLRENASRQEGANATAG